MTLARHQRSQIVALAIGGVLGCLFALWVARFTRSILYGITPAQPEAYAAAIGVVVAIAASAIRLHSRAW